MSTDRRKLQQVLVITGVTRGLGRALVVQCNQTDELKTCRVFGCGRNEKKIKELNEQYGPQYVFTSLSTSDYTAVMRWAAAVVKECGGRGPHLLINNAGLMNEPSPLWEVEKEEFQKVVDTNIHGYYNVIKARTSCHTHTHTRHTHTHMTHNAIQQIHLIIHQRDLNFLVPLFRHLYHQ